MSALVKFAENELRIAGLLDKDSDYEGMLGQSVLELTKEFASQGHSGFSAAQTLKIFARVASFEPLSPLRGDDDEWQEVGTGVFQNVRCSHIFKENGQAYDIEGRIFREPSGVCYTNSESRVPVTFPYVPNREYVDVAG